MIRFFDTHCHLNLSQFDSDRDDIARELLAQSIGAFVVGVNIPTSRLAVSLAHNYSHLRAIVGFHPAYYDEYGSFSVAQFTEIAKQGGVIGIGECGLDYFRVRKTPALFDEQKRIFCEQIELALSLDLPLMLHIRPNKDSFDAYEDALLVLDGYRNESRLRGQAHFFAGDSALALEYVRRGFYISCTGVITFTNDFDEMLRSVPLDRLLCETDSPFVAPVPHRGGRCIPTYVEYVYQRLAEIRGIGLSDLEAQIAKNVEGLYGFW